MKPPDTRRVPRWSALYVLLLLAATLTPLWQTCRISPLVWRINPYDFLQNLLLFLPAGVALRRLRPSLVVLLVVVVSAGIEALQTMLPRTPGGMDVVANTLGAWLGRLIPWPASLRSRVDERAVWVGVWGLRVVAVLAIGMIGILAATRRPDDFSNWERYPVVVGNEATGDRPWHGEIYELAVYDRVLESQPSTAPIGPPAWNEGGPILWLRFAPEYTGRLDGPLGPRSVALPEPLPPGLALADGLSVRGGTWVLPEAVSDALFQRLVESNALTLTARVKAARRDAIGPTRILSFSSDPYHRNFTLGQFDANLEMRVRTPNTGDNGIDVTVRSDGERLADGSAQILASYDGPVGRIFFGDVCAGEELYPAIYPVWVMGRGIAASIVACCALGGLAFASFPVRSRSRGLALGLGGAAAWGALRLAGAWAHFPDYDPIAAGLAITAIAASAPLLPVLAPNRRRP